MSPRSTLKIWGSSSILVRRSQAPKGKTRGSFRPVIALPAPSRRCMVRSLYMVKPAPWRPTRRARYSTGPGLERRIPIAATARSGAASARPSSPSATSSGRLTMAVDAPHGHEHFRSLHTVLVTPGDGAVSQRVERAGVGIGAKLALVARHRRQLGLEGGGDVHPHVGDEAAGEGPLGAARGVERVDRPDAVFRGPRRDEGGLEEQLVVPVHVAAVLAVDDIGAHLADPQLQGGDDVREGDSVEPLIGE